jgi:hypothetical protein
MSNALKNFVFCVGFEDEITHVVFIGDVFVAFAGMACHHDDERVLC